MQTFITKSKEETIALAEKLAKVLKNHDIIYFYGGLGMGKTAFCQGLCNGLGINQVAVSPTFTIVNVYDGEKSSLYHFDMYRIENEDQLYNIGFYDYLDYDGVIAIEWSENIDSFVKEPGIKVIFEKVDDSTRKITIDGAYIEQ